MHTRQSPISSRKALHHDVAVTGYRTGVLALLVQIRQQVGRRQLVERRALAQPGARLFGLHAPHGARELTERAPELDRPARAVTAPERHAPGLTGSRLDDDAVTRDLDHPPGAGAQEEGVAEARLVDHLLVELADARPVFAQVHAEEAAVGNRARIHARHHGGALARAEQVSAAVPGQARAQIGEVVRRIVPGEHVEKPDQQLGGQIAEGVAPPQHGLDLGDGAWRVAAVGHHLLRGHVERVGRNADRLEIAGQHALRDDGALEQVALELREHLADAHLADAVPGPADALQTARHRAR